MIFSAWDTVWYVSIAHSGYYWPAWAFMPSYPSVIWLLNLLPLGGEYASAAVVAALFSIAGVVVYQRLAETYMTVEDAVTSTVIMVTFPFVLLFLTLSYAESVFLFATVSSWYLHRRGRVAGAALAAAFATLTRPYGILISLPIVFGLLRAKRLGAACLSITVPALALISWAAYCELFAGTVFATLTSQQVWSYEGGFILGFLPSIVSGRFYVLQSRFLWIALAFTLLFPQVYRLDRQLSIYVFSSFIVLLLLGAVSSLVRFVPSIFPLWFTIRERSLLRATIFAGLFMAVTFTLWYFALRGVLIA
jgi:Gpi18-like mannosyltransferase